jgi:hypothetical protein
VLTALPVDRQNDFTCRLVDIDNNIHDQCTNQLLAHAHGDTRRIPGYGKVFGKLCKVRRGDIHRRCACRLQTGLAGLYTT